MKLTFLTQLILLAGCAPVYAQWYNDTVVVNNGGLVSDWSIQTWNTANGNYSTAGSTGAPGSYGVFEHYGQSGNNNNSAFRNDGIYNASVNGRDYFKGPGDSSGQQGIGGSVAPVFGELLLENGTGQPFDISNANGADIAVSASFANGITTTVRGAASTGALRFRDNAVYINTAAGDTQYVNGYVTKSGDDAFTFPVGAQDGTDVRTLQISAPASVNNTLSVAYWNGSADSGLDPTPFGTQSLSSLNPSGITGIDKLASVSPICFWDWVAISGTSSLTVTGGNVMNNDTDPDGDPIMVTPQNITTAAGTFVVDATGNYTFTPATGTHGPVQVPYTVCDTAGNCATATLHILVDPVNTLEPDFNVTNINTPVNGNLSTNDELVSGSAFGTPVANTGNPTADLPTLNSNGSYSFTPDTAGVYTFYVPVCAPGQPSPCPTETLTITVLDPLTPVFPPVVNPDNATGMSNTPVTINITGNDDPTSPGGSFGTPGITTPPSNGTVVVNTNGTVDYTPTPGFTGVDSFTYTICDTVPTPDQCGSATVTVNVLPPNAINSVAANDDYVNTYGTVAATGNVLLNDNDPEGNTLTVTSQNVITSQGTLILSDNGQYTFTPASGFTGTTSFTYTVCDNGTPQACDQATLHILVDKAPDYTPLVFGSNTLFSNNDTARNFIVAIYNVNNTINKGPVKFRMSQSLPNKAFIIDPAMATINYNGNAVAVSNAAWDIVLNGSIYEFTLKPNAIITPNGSMYIGFTVKVPGTAPYNQVQPVTANIIYQSGGDSNYSNNNYSITITKN